MSIFKDTPHLVCSRCHGSEEGKHFACETELLITKQIFLIILVSEICSFDFSKVTKIFSTSINYFFWLVIEVFYFA